MNLCENCRNKFTLEDAGFIWQGLAFCEFCDPETAN
jgi:hypothetical protein